METIPAKASLEDRINVYQAINNLQCFTMARANKTINLYLEIANSHRPTLYLVIKIQIPFLILNKPNSLIKSLFKAFSTLHNPKTLWIHNHKQTVRYLVKILLTLLLLIKLPWTYLRDNKTQWGWIILWLVLLINQQTKIPLHFHFSVVKILLSPKLRKEVFLAW